LTEQRQRYQFGHRQIDTAEQHHCADNAYTEASDGLRKGADKKAGGKQKLARRRAMERHAIVLRVLALRFHHHLPEEQAA